MEENWVRICSDGESKEGRRTDRTWMIHRDSGSRKKTHTGKSMKKTVRRRQTKCRLECETEEDVERNQSGWKCGCMQKTKRNLQEQVKED